MGRGAAPSHDACAADGRGPGSEGPRVPERRAGRASEPRGVISAAHFSPDTQDLIRLLHRHEVRYLIVGGEAVIHYGHVRLTGDVDFFYATDPANCDRLYAALESFWSGPVPALASAAELSEPDLVLQFGRPPNRIDLLARISGVAFEQAWPNRRAVPVDFGGEVLALRYIGLQDLLRNKRASGRPKDLDDLRYLQPGSDPPPGP